MSKIFCLARSIEKSKPGETPLTQMRVTPALQAILSLYCHCCSTLHRTKFVLGHRQSTYFSNQSHLYENIPAVDRTGTLSHKVGDFA